MKNGVEQQYLRMFVFIFYSLVFMDEGLKKLIIFGLGVP